MPKRKKQSKKKLHGQARLNDAKSWLRQLKQPPEDFVEAYANRYGISHQTAWDELMQIGYYDEILIQAYKKEGIEYEYMVEPLSGEMYVVPKGTREDELYDYHSFF